MCGIGGPFKPNKVREVRGPGLEALDKQTIRDDQALCTYRNPAPSELFCLSGVTQSPSSGPGSPDIHTFQYSFAAIAEMHRGITVPSPHETHLKRP